MSIIKSLKNREDITFWLLEDALENWEIKDTVIQTKGRQTKYSKIALETIYTLRQIFNLRLRQVEGFTRSLLKTKTVKYK